MHGCQECGFSYEAEATAAAIRDGVGEVEDLLLGSSELRARQQPEVWSPLEYGCHLRDVLLVQRERVLAARRSDRYVCTSMGRDERVDHDGYRSQEPEDVARQLADAAQLFGNVLDRLDAADWMRVVIYPYPEPTERSLRWVAAHTLHEVRHHLMDIRRQLGHANWLR